MGSPRVLIPSKPLTDAWTLNQQWRINLLQYVITFNLQFKAIMYWALLDTTARDYGFNRFGIPARYIIMHKKHKCI